MGNHNKLLDLFSRPDPAASSSESDDDEDYYSPSTTATTSAAASPYAMSPWTQLPGLLGADAADPKRDRTATGLLGSLVKEDGHVYSLAAAGDLLYTGTDSRNVRVWRDRREVLGGLRSGSGLVKAIVVAADGRIYTGHQDGKVRVWRRRDDDADEGGVRHRRVGSLPRVRDVVARSLSLLPSRRGRNVEAAPLRHADAVSCLSLDAAAGLLYSASWDRTVKVWRVSDSRCLETLRRAHDDAVNAVAAAGFGALLLTGSADGTVKVWRREATTDSRRKRQGTRHAVDRVLRRQGDGGGAVTSIAVAVDARVVYVGSSDGAVTHWQWRRGGGTVVCGGALRGHRMAVLCLAVAGRVIASGSADRTVSVWRREEGARHARLAVLKGHTGPVKCLAMDEEEEVHDDDDGGGERRWVVYSGSLDGSVKVWRVSDSGISPDESTTPPTHLWKGTTPPTHLRKGTALTTRSSWSRPYAAFAPERNRVTPA